MFIVKQKCFQKLTYGSNEKNTKGLGGESDDALSGKCVFVAIIISIYHTEKK